MTAPILVFGWGNPSRGDDALGPLLLERIEAMNLPDVECLTDFQLQVEHALDLKGRQRVLFVDASIDTEAPFSISAIGPGRDASFTSHAMSPQSVLQVYSDIHNSEPPPTWLLAIRAERFELGDGLSASAAGHLEAAISWARDWLAQAAVTSGPQDSPAPGRSATDDTKKNALITPLDGR